MSIVLIFISEYTYLYHWQGRTILCYYLNTVEYSFLSSAPFGLISLLKQGPNYKLVYITKIISESYVIDVIYKL